MLLDNVSYKNQIGTICFYMLSLSHILYREKNTEIVPLSGSLPDYKFLFFRKLDQIYNESLKYFAYLLAFLFVFTIKISTALHVRKEKT